MASSATENAARTSSDEWTDTQFVIIYKILSFNSLFCYLGKENNNKNKNERKINSKFGSNEKVFERERKEKMKRNKIRFIWLLLYFHQVLIPKLIKVDIKLCLQTITQKIPNPTK